MAASSTCRWRPRATWAWTAPAPAGYASRSSAAPPRSRRPAPISCSSARSSNRANAESLRERLRAAGYRAELTSGPGVTRVVIRNLNAADADRITAELADRGFPTPLRRLQNG